MRTFTYSPLSVIHSMFPHTVRSSGGTVNAAPTPGTAVPTGAIFSLEETTATDEKVVFTVGSAGMSMRIDTTFGCPPQNGRMRYSCHSPSPIHWNGCASACGAALSPGRL